MKMQKLEKASFVLSIAAIIMVVALAFLSHQRTDGVLLILNGIVVYLLLFGSIGVVMGSLVLGIIGLFMARKKKYSTKVYMFSVLSMSLLVLLGIYLTYFN